MRSRDRREKTLGKAIRVSLFLALLLAFGFSMTRYVAQAQTSTPVNVKPNKSAPPVAIDEIEPLRQCLQRCNSPKSFFEEFNREVDREAAVRKLMAWAVEDGKDYTAVNFMLVANDAQVEELIYMANVDCDTAYRLRDLTSALLNIWKNKNRTKAKEMAHLITDPRWWKTKDGCFINDEMTYNMKINFVRQINTLAWVSDEPISKYIDEIITLMPPNFERNHCSSLRDAEYENRWVMEVNQKYKSTKTWPWKFKNYGKATNIVSAKKLEYMRLYRQFDFIANHKTTPADDQISIINYCVYSMDGGNILFPGSILIQHKTEAFSSEEEKKLFLLSLYAYNAIKCISLINNDRCLKYNKAENFYDRNLIPGFENRVVDLYTSEFMGKIQKSRAEYITLAGHLENDTSVCIDYYKDGFKEIYGKELLLLE